MRDQLIGHIVQVCSDHLRLEADSQDVIARATDKAALQPAATAPRVSYV
jgi:hypothetical protein